MRLVILIILLLNVISTSAQKIDNMASYMDFNQSNYFRVNYENDYFTATDRNYTQGYSLEYMNALFKKNPINHLFLQPKNAMVKAGLAFEHLGFTPKNLSSHEIELGDRPYAATAMLKSFLIATDTLTNIRVSSSFSLGIIGPMAMGYEIQSGIHAAIDGVEPSGWKHQIDNHVVISYEVGLEKELINLNDILALRANSNLKVGTLFSQASLGTNLIIGKLNTPYSKTSSKFSFYVYAQPLFNAIAYDATLQGGLVGDKSPYTIPSRNLERFNLQVKYGAVMHYKKIFLAYSRANITKEFSTGTNASWGGVHVGFRI